MKRVMEARNEKEVWEIVNRERRKKRGINAEIEIGEWTEHFRVLLEGMEKKAVVRRLRGGGREGIDRGEIRKVLRGLKEGKATGTDGIPNEALKYGGEKMEEWIYNFCNRVWKGGDWVEE